LGLESEGKSARTTKFLKVPKVKVKKYLAQQSLLVPAHTPKNTNIKTTVDAFRYLKCLTTEEKISANCVRLDRIEHNSTTALVGRNQRTNTLRYIVADNVLDELWCDRKQNDQWL
jgi:hypothetical protein